MSRIGKNPIEIPQGVTISVNAGVIEVKGPKGTLVRNFRDEVKIEVAGSEVVCTIDKNTKSARSLWGTYASHIKNMIKGVTEGYEKKLEIEGVGYKAKLEGSKLILNLGFSHTIEVDSPEGITFEVEKTKIKVSGIDKEAVGQIAAKIRAYKKPEPYKGKGIHYEGEYIRRKAGKKAATTA